MEIAFDTCPTFADYFAVPKTAITPRVLERLMTAPRWLVLPSSALLYALAVRQVRYGFGSGIPMIDQGIAWHFLAIACAIAGTVSAIRIARKDLVGRPNATRTIRVVGRIAVVFGGILVALEAMALAISIALPVFLPGAHWPD